MTSRPETGISPITEIIADLKAGRMVVLVDEADRENEGDLLLAAEHVTPETVNFMARYGRGLICLTLTEEKCRALNLAPMVANNRSPLGTNFTVSIEAAEGVTTGISAADRARTVQVAIRADATPRDLVQPGHVFPLVAQDGGVLVRAGHTEAGCDLARLAGLTPAAVICEILKDNGEMARLPDLVEFAARHKLRIGTIADLIQHRLRTEHTIERVDERDVRTDHGPFRLVTYRDRIAHELHFALVRGTPGGDAPTLVRVHVKNQLSDLLHLERADLGLSLSQAMAEIARSECGVVVVLSQPAHPDTVLARLRKEPLPQPGVAEWRRNGAGAQILADLGARRLRVLGTPRRQVALAGFGLEVVDYVGPQAEPACERLPAAPGKLGA